MQGAASCTLAATWRPTQYLRSCFVRRSFPECCAPIFGRHRSRTQTGSAWAQLAAMGQDYTARKAAKKTRKRSAPDGAKSEGPKRERKKKNAPRRLCRGMCYAQPQLTEEDRQWRGEEEEGSDGDAPRGVYDSDVEEAVQEQAAAAKRSASSSKDAPASKKLKMSTAVPLLTAAQLMGKTVLDTDMPAGAAAAAAADHADTSVTPLEALNRLAASASTAAADGDGSTAAADSSLSAYDPLIQGAMRQLKFNEATPVQAAVWAAACRGQDVQAVAEPGTGKTLAYLLPALVRVHQLLQQELGAGSHATSSSRVEPLVLVVAPSRELAQQVWGVCKRLYAATRLSSAVVYGGVDKQEQLALLQRRRPLLLAATPGRLLDLLDSSSSGAAGAEAQQQQQGGLSLARVQLLVLDEADKMLSVGFRPQLERIAAQLALLGPPAADGTASGGGGNAAEEPEKRKKKKKQAKGLAMQQQGGRQRPQVLLLTATMDPELRQVADAWLQDPLRVRVNQGADAISKTITQVVHVCAEHKKPAKLLKHLKAVQDAAAGQRQKPQVLVFANRIKTVRFIHTTLQQAGYRAAMLHGQRSQAERNAALLEFKSGKAQVLVASDVAARGLDIHGLPYVVNYDFPGNLDTYIHRVGRTGRLGAHGQAYSFLTRNMAKLAPDLVGLLQHHEQSIDPNLIQLAEAWNQVQEVLKLKGELAAAAAAGALQGGAAGGEDGEEEEAAEVAAAAGGGTGLSLPEDLHEGLGQPQQKSRKKKKQEQQDLAADELQELTPEGFEAAFQALLQQQMEGSGGEDSGSTPAKQKKRKKQKPAAGGSDSEEGGAPRRQQQGVGAGSSKAAGTELLVPRGPKGAAAPKAAAAAGSAGEAGLPHGAPGGQEYQASSKFAGAKPGYVFKKGPKGLGYYWDFVGAAAAAQRAAKQQQQKQQQQEVFRAAKQQQQQQQQQQQAQKAARAKKQQQAAKKRRAGDSSDSSDEDGGGGQRKKHKALPGRLRKKLAKDRAGGGGRGGAGGGGRRGGGAGGRGGGRGRRGGRQ